MPTFAAIDIGSNSCRLKIAKVVAHQLKTLAEDREVTRLGASVFESGLVSPEAMTQTLRALKRFQRAVQAHGVDQIRVVATSAMRDARNGAAFQAWVKAETGWNLEIISGLEEGRLIHLGVWARSRERAGKCCWSTWAGAVARLRSQNTSGLKRRSACRWARCGSRRIFTCRSGSCRGAGADAAVDTEGVAPGVAQDSAGEGAAGDCDFRHGGGAERCVCGRAQVRLNRAASGAGGKPASQAPVDIVPARAVRTLSKLLAKMTLPEREAVPGIGPRRAEIIVAGAEVYAELLGELWAGRFPLFAAGVAGRNSGADAGRAGRAATAHREFEHERWESVLATARRYGVDPKQAEPVRAHAVQLFAN
jgi:exopolyphosphatase/guanosine-5'-triphosphate,3'-diphosphate pyrophosphatase